MRRLITAIILFAAIAAACQRAQIPTAEVNVARVSEITLDPNSSEWNEVPLHVSKLILQDLVEPRLMTASTAEVSVKAMTNGNEIAVRLEWADETANDMPGPRQFIDSCAVQLPQRVEPNAPAPQMGEVGKGVQIAFWRADWQAIVDGRKDTINSLYPNATVDHYPSEAKPLEGDPQAQSETAQRYAPARALGNRRAGPREQPVEDLLAEGPGTLTPAAAVSKGKGVRTGNGWAVVISRPMPAGFDAATPTQIAFAVWEGSNTETGSRKMRTGWVPMLLK
ncbi:MAG: ethylbenzene dehydrogenase-related protein [Pyrinomonadaceae bacterium]|nr:ethylbenzene dehydrogenase-related protein [Pyrinomonadaceae bacterium]